jgi:3-mercaptopyruvate sulfurtransferase SseA
MKTEALAAVLVALALSALPFQRAGATGEDGVEFIAADDLRRLQQTPRRIVIVDVRSPGEFRATRIKGAVNVPLSELERRFTEIPRQGLVVLY